VRLSRNWRSRFIDCLQVRGVTERMAARGLEESTWELPMSGIMYIRLAVIAELICLTQTPS